jgi:hypothetical protein
MLKSKKKKKIEICAIHMENGVKFNLYGSVRISVPTE